MNENTRDSWTCLLGSNRGIYIPKNFAEWFREQGFFITADPLTDDLDYLIETGVEGDAYWDTWDYVLNNMSLIEISTGKTFVLHQDEDLWLIPADYDWDADELQN